MYIHARVRICFGTRPLESPCVETHGLQAIGLQPAGHGGLARPHIILYFGLQIDKRLVNSLLGLDRLGISLVIALGRNEVDQFTRQVDVGVFDRAAL